MQLATRTPSPTLRPLDPSIDCSRFSADEFALYQRLCAHPLEGSAHAPDLTQRFAAEQFIELFQARRIVREYRRFCFLACVAGPATPPVWVDQFWHLHLTASVDYWRHYCPNTLGCDLHHAPSLGGMSQRAAHQAQYAATRAAYFRYFGSPPHALWPSDMLSGGPLRRDPRRYWAIRKPRWPQRLLAAVALLLSPILPAQELGPLDWSGPDFLMLYGVLLVVAVIAVRIIRGVMRQSDATRVPELSPSELALLANGRRRAALTDITALLGSGQAQLDGKLSVLSVNAGTLASSEPAASLQRLIRSDGDVGSVLKNAEPLYARSEEKLIERGLLQPFAQRLRGAVLVTLPLTALMIVGWAKVFIGMSRDKPVAWLVVVLCLTLIVALVMGFAGSRVSPAVHHHLDKLRRSVAPKGKRAPGVALPMAVAVFGTVVLADTAFADWHDASRRYSDSGSSGDSSGSSDSDSGSDGGSDGGGGGCGGCGGGD